MSNTVSTPSILLIYSRYAPLWPLFALLAAELLGLWVVITVVEPVLAPFSVVISFCVLLTGWLPALLKPNTASMLAACFATLLAGVLIIPPETHVLTATFRALNGVSLAFVALHAAARFTERSPLPWSIRFICYGGILILLPASILTTNDWWNSALTLLLAIFVLGMFILVIHWLNNPDDTQLSRHWHAVHQVRLLLLIVTAAEVLLIVRLLSRPFDINVPYNVVLGAQILLPLGVTYVILRHDLFGIDAVMRRAFAYAGVSLVLLIGYLGLTVGLTAVMTEIVSAFPFITAFISLGIAAVVFEPLRQRVQQLVDKLFYPEHLMFQDGLQSVQTSLAHVMQRTEIEDLLLNALPQSLGATDAQLHLDPTQTTMPVLSRSGWHAPLVVGGTIRGYYWLGPRCGGLPYNADERTQLHTLLQQAALALAYADTFDALNTLNRELEERVTTRTEQLVAQQRSLAIVEDRQRLARDLHDSVTQTIFSIGVSACAIRTLVDSAPQTAIEALRDQETMAHQALDEMRALLTQLWSPLLQDGDLIQGLKSYSTILQRHHGFTVTLEAPPSRPLPSDIAHHLFCIAKEALHNSVKHSGVNQAVVQLDYSNTTITLSVSDDGCGFVVPGEQDTTFHLGLQGMRERVAAMGGILTINSATGCGTTTRVQIKDVA